MIILKGPWPRVKKTVILRNPEFGDTLSDVNTDYTIKRDMRGNYHTFISQDNKAISFSFQELTHTEATELESFLLEYIGKTILMQSHNGKRYVGSLVADPVVFTEDIDGVYSTNLEFLGRELTYENNNV